MQIIIMRHGDATFFDEQRVLSSKGEQEVKLVGLKLISEFKITKIMASPVQRALQSASIVRNLLRGRNIPEIEVVKELEPCGNTLLACDYLEATCEENDTVLVLSHIPQVVNLCYAFCQKEVALPMFHTASALVLERPDAQHAFSPCLFHTPYGETCLSNKIGANNNPLNSNLDSPLVVDPLANLDELCLNNNSISCA